MDKYRQGVSDLIVALELYMGNHDNEQVVNHAKKTVGRIKASMESNVQKRHGDNYKRIKSRLLGE
jgi:hypothetical protein